MKRRDNKRNDSENSDDTRISQDTTITNVSNNSNSEITNGIETITEKDEKTDHEKVIFDIGDAGNIDLTQSVTNSIEIDEKAAKAHVSLHHENVKDKAAHVYSNQILDGVNSHSCDCCYSSCFTTSHDTEPLLNGVESIKFSKARNGVEVSQVSKEAKDKSIAHAKSYPTEISCDKGISCACGKNARDQKNNADNNVKSITESYIGLKTSYRTIRRVLVVLGILDLILIICVLTVVPTVVITTSRAPSPWTTASPRDEDPNGYNICFDCADLDKDRAFSAETLRGVYRRDGSCCFKSITSVYFSIKQMFQNQVDDGIKSLNKTMTYLQKLMVNGTIANRNVTTDNFVARLLMFNPRSEKIAAHLVSEDGPPEQDNTVSGVFYKVRWTLDSDKTVLRGKAGLWNGVNLQVQREGYYFIYTRLHFQSKPGHQNIAITYSINRQRGSTSTYIHEVNESCRTAGPSLEHGGVVEMVVHLLRNDEIFISVSKSDIEYLATEPGSHMLGLFEL